MIGRLLAGLKPTIHVRIGHDRITVRRDGHPEVVVEQAPFSCSHTLVSDIDILEHAMKRALDRLPMTRGWVFPIMVVEVEGTNFHWLERKVVKDALANAGASEVTFAESVPDCTERKEERDAYVRAHTKRP